MSGKGLASALPSVDFGGEALSTERRVDPRFYASAPADAAASALYYAPLDLPTSNAHNEDPLYVCALRFIRAGVSKHSIVSTLQPQDAPDSDRQPRHCPRHRNLAPTGTAADDPGSRASNTHRSSGHPESDLVQLESGRWRCAVCTAYPKA